MSIDDPRDSPYCWSSAEVGTPDATIRTIACSRGRHWWGKHRNRHVRWACPPRCGCVRHARKRTAPAEEQQPKAPADGRYAEAVARVESSGPRPAPEA